MEKTILKNSWKIYLANFGKLFAFSLSSFFLLFAGCSLFTVLGVYDLGISSILLFAFVVVPMFFALEIMMARASAGTKVEYNDIYNSYKSYFNQTNKGTYSIIINLLLTFVIYSLSIYLSLVIYDIFHYGVLEDIMKNYSLNNIQQTQYIELINKILNMDNYIYYLTMCMLIPILFFFSRIKRNLMVPYLNMIMPLPNILVRNINKKIYKKNAKIIRKLSWVGNLCFALVFSIGYIIGSLIGIYLGDIVPYVNYIFLLGLFFGLLLSSFLLPPVLINYCFIADSLHNDYLDFVKQQMIKITENFTSKDENKDDIIKKMIDDLNKINKDDDQ